MTSWFDVPNHRYPYARGPHLLEGQARFNTLSLGNWVTLAEAVGIPVVPIIYLGALSGKDLAAFQDNCGDFSRIMALNSALQALEGDWFVRSDASSGDCVKGAMGRPLSPGQDRLAQAGARSGFGYTQYQGKRFVELDDGRLDEQVSIWPEEDCPFWARPIVKARQIETENGPYQAEWRVFVRDGRIAAVSTYYPQAPRAVDAADFAALDLSIAYSLRLIDIVRSRGLVPDHPAYQRFPDFDPESVSFSIDFIEREDGQVLLLECGPTSLHRWGAHPCAFDSKDTGLDVEIAGIAWGGGRIDPPAVLEDRIAHLGTNGLDLEP
jgi:hypothetical protein